MPYIDLATGRAHGLGLTSLQRVVFDIYLHFPNYMNGPCPGCCTVLPTPHADGCLLVKYADDHRCG